jgi:hypothetical protein
VNPYQASVSGSFRTQGAHARWVQTQVSVHRSKIRAAAKSRSDRSKGAAWVSARGTTSRVRGEQCSRSKPRQGRMRSSHVQRREASTSSWIS